MVIELVRSLEHVHTWREIDIPAYFPHAGEEYDWMLRHPPDYDNDVRYLEEADHLSAMYYRTYLRPLFGAIAGGWLECLLTDNICSNIVRGCPEIERRDNIPKYYVSIDNPTDGDSFTMAVNGNMGGIVFLLRTIGIIEHPRYSGPGGGHNGPIMMGQSHPSEMSLYGVEVGNVLIPHFESFLQRQNLDDCMRLYEKGGYTPVSL